MSRLKQNILIVLLLVSALLALYLYRSSAKLEIEKRVFENFKKQSAELILLKEKWKSGRDYKKIFARLKAISKPSKEKTEGKRYIIDFENLSQLSLERIVRILFSSGFVIKALDIEKNSKKIALHVEVLL